MEARNEPQNKLGELAPSWHELDALAESEDWEALTRGLAARLDEEEFHLKRNGPGVNFVWLGWRVLIYSSSRLKSGDLKKRLNLLEKAAHQILGERHRLLNSTDQRLEQIQSLLAINTSAAWAELASILRRDLRNPEWALEACRIALTKDWKNSAAITAQIAALRELGKFQEAHLAFQKIKAIGDTSEYSRAAISKVEMLEGDLRDALENALLAFDAKQSEGVARLVGNIYDQLGETKNAHKWFSAAEFIEETSTVELTEAHVKGLLKLSEVARSRLSDLKEPSE